MADEQPLGELLAQAWANVSDTHPNMFVGQDPETVGRALAAIHEALRSQQVLLDRLVGQVAPDKPLPPPPSAEPAEAEEDEEQPAGAELQASPPDTPETQGRQEVQARFQALTEPSEDDSADQRRPPKE